MDELVLAYNYKAVIASGFPFTTMLLSKALKIKFPQVRFIYDVGDPFYNNSQNGFFRNQMAKKFERKFLAYIDKLVVTNKVTLKHYLTNFGDVISPEQITIIQQGVPLELLKKLEYFKNNVQADRGKNEVVLVYAGQLYMKLREPFQLYKSIQMWNQGNTSKLRLEMYGTFSDIFKQVDESYTNINFKGKVSNAEALEAYYKGDIVVFLDNAYGLQTPGKVFEVASIGKPVLFISDHPDSPAFEVVSHLKHIHCCRNNPESIIETLKLIDFNVEYNSILEVRRDFSWEKRADQYRSIINIQANSC